MLLDGIAIVSCLTEKEEQGIFDGFGKVCYVERKPQFPAVYYGFDYTRCGEELAESIIRHEYKNVLLIHSTLRYSNEKETIESFNKRISGIPCNVIDVSTDSLRLYNTLLAVFEEYETIEAIVTTNLGFAERIRQICNSLILVEALPIYTISPMFTLPEKDYIKYELNYSLLGRQAAEECIGKSKTKKTGVKGKRNKGRYHKRRTICRGPGFRTI